MSLTPSSVIFIASSGFNWPSILIIDWCDNISRFVMLWKWNPPYPPSLGYKMVPSSRWYFERVLEVSGGGAQWKVVLENVPGNVFRELLSSPACSCLHVLTSVYYNVSRFAVSHVPCHNQDVLLSAIIPPDNHGKKLWAKRMFLHDGASSDTYHSNETLNYILINVVPNLLHSLSLFNYILFFLSSLILDK